MPEKKKRSDFLKEFEEEIREFAEDTIAENRSTYFDGFTSVTEDDIESVIEENMEEFVDEYAKEKGIEIA